MLLSNENMEWACFGLEYYTWVASTSEIKQNIKAGLNPLGIHVVYFNNIIQCTVVILQDIQIL